MSSLPVPTNLVLLQDLKSLDSGTKVRFLGCVDGYDIPSSTLRLHHFPAEDSRRKLIACVDVSLLAETLSATDTALGAWVNVIGYVRKGKRGQVDVQALMLWNAGAIDLGAYERAVVARREVAAIDRRVREEGQESVG